MSENNPFRKVTTEEVVTKVEEVKESAKVVEPKKILKAEPIIKMIKVKSILKGWYNNSRIEEGEEFTIPENLFSKTWMQKL